MTGLPLRHRVRGWVDDLLRGQAHGHTSPRALVMILVFCGSGYGLVMGSFGGNPWQMGYSAVKVPMLLAVTFVVSLPPFFVLNTLLGLRGDFRQVLRALVAAQAGLTIILLSLAPYTMLWYASSAHYSAAVAFNSLMFGTASLTSQLLLIRYYRPLIARNPNHRLMLRTWILIYAFVGIQTGWMARPFIGSPRHPAVFLRADQWTNAWVVVSRLFRNLLAGS